MGASTAFLIYSDFNVFKSPNVYEISVNNKDTTDQLTHSNSSVGTL